MLELIFQGFAEWSYAITLEIWAYFSSSMLEIMSLDFAYLKTHIPVLTDIMQVLMAVGWALLLGNLVFQAVRSMATGLGFDGEDPRLLFARTMVFAFLLLASPQICEIGLNLTSNIIALLDIPDNLALTLLDETAFLGLGSAWLLVILCGIIVMFKVLKLLLAIAERYLILAVLTLTAPLAFAMGGSKSTSPIFSGWCRMFGSMCLLMVTNVIFFKMLFSVLAAVPVGLDVFPWMVLVFAITKVAQKADGIITRIGLNPAPTGNTGHGLPGVLAFTVARTAASQVVKNVSGGSSDKGKSSGKPPNGTPKGPAGGSQGAGRSTSAGTNSSHTQRETSQNTAQNTESRQTNNNQSQSKTSQSAAKTSAHTDSQQTASQQTTAQERSTAQATESNRRETSQRSTSVPSGTRRGPNHVSSPGSAKGPQPGPAGTGTSASHTTQTTSQNVRTGSVQATSAEQKTVRTTRTETRSTHREQGKRPSGTTTTTQQRTSSTAQQETRSTSVSCKSPVNSGVSVIRPGSAGNAPPATSTTTTERRTSNTVRQETRSTSVSGKSPVSGGATVTHPGPAGTVPPTTTATTTERRTSSTARQETRSTSVSAKSPVSGNTTVTRSGPAGTVPPATAAPTTERRTSSTVWQETGRTSSPAKPPVNGSGPVIHPGPAGNAAGNRPAPKAPQTRTTRVNRPPRPPEKGGTGHG